MNKVTEKMRFQLKALARRHEIKTLGLDNFDIVTRIIDNSTKLTSDEEKILDEICKAYDCSLEMLKGKGGA